MTHGFMLSKHGNGVADMSLDYKEVLREMRCAFACGSGMVEVYADFSLMNSIDGGKLWDDLADCIRWQKAQEDVLPDVHWVGGNPWDGKKANVYGWAAWNGERATLALRNPSATAQVFTTTLREVFDIPDYIHTSITLSDAFSQTAIYGLDKDVPIDIDRKLRLRLFPLCVYVYNGVDEAATGIEAPPASSAAASRDDAIYDLSGRRLSRGTALPKGIYIDGHRKVVRR